MRYAGVSQVFLSFLSGAVWAAREWYHSDPVHYPRMDALYQEICQEFGQPVCENFPVTGAKILSCMRQEEESLKKRERRDPHTVRKTKE